MIEGYLVAVVDDDESVRQAVAGLLRSAGAQVVSFASADAFLAFRHWRSVACLVLDLRMPVTDGFALLEHVAVGSHLPRVVVLTSHEDDESRMRAYRAGALAFLAKPFDADALLAAVDLATDDRLLAPRLQPRARG